MRTLFAALSLADLLLTWWLLTFTGAVVYESNPLANWCLRVAGWLGLAAFKVGLVAAVLLLVARICRHRPRTGQRVLAFGCLVLALVVGYSGVLVVQGQAWAAALERDLDELNAASAGDFETRVVYAKFRSDLARSWCAGHYTLAQASARLNTAERLRDPRWLLDLPAYEGLSLPECLARQLVSEAGVQTYQTQTRATALPLLARLRGEYVALFGHDLPDDLLSAPPQ